MTALESRLRDARSRRVAFVSHCLLNENVRYLGGATRPGAVDEVVDGLVAAGTGICQMPCPEQLAWGGVLKPWMTRFYGSRLTRWSPTRRIVVALARSWTVIAYGRLARRVAADVADYVSNGFGVVELIGVGASPSCGVRTTVDLEAALLAMGRCERTRLSRRPVNDRVVLDNRIPGPGMFIAAVQRELRRRGIAVRMSEHDLAAELMQAGYAEPPRDG